MPDRSPPPVGRRRARRRRRRRGATRREVSAPAAARRQRRRAGRRSDTTTSSRPKKRRIATTAQAPPTMTSARSRGEAGVVDPIGQRLGDERAVDVLGRRPAQHEAVDAGAVVDRPGPARPRRTSGTCRPGPARSAPRPGPRGRRADVVEVGLDDRQAGHQLLGPGRVVVDPVVGEAGGAELDRARGSPVAWRTRRTRRRGRRRRTGPSAGSTSGRSRPGRRGAPPPRRRAPRGRTPSDARRRGRGTSSRVGRSAQRPRWRSTASRGAPRARSTSAPAAPARQARVAADARRGRAGPLAPTPSPRPVTTVSRSTVAPAVGDEQPGRRGASRCRRPDAAHAARPSPRHESAAQAGGDPATDRVVAAGEVPGVVGVEALHARRACRRRRRDGRGPGASRAGAPRRARRRSGGGRRRASSGSTSASARRTPPAASSRLTATDAARPDQPVAGRHRACRRRAAARCGSRPGRRARRARPPERRPGAGGRAARDRGAVRLRRRRSTGRRCRSEGATLSGGGDGAGPAPQHEDDGQHRGEALEQRRPGGVEQVDRLDRLGAGRSCARPVGSAAVGWRRRSTAAPVDGAPALGAAVGRRGGGAGGRR